MRPISFTPRAVQCTQHWISHNIRASDARDPYSGAVSEQLGSDVALGAGYERIVDPFRKALAKAVSSATEWKGSAGLNAALRKQVSRLAKHV
jgi:hypothetical protein